jgi:glutathione S-transferase
MLKIYHLERTRGERAIWACEEMDIPYELMMTPGEFAQAYQRLHEANPIMHTAPTVIDEDGRMLMESGAILEWLRLKYGKGKLAPPDEGSFEYFTYLKWLHFAEASAMTRILIDMYIRMHLWEAAKGVDALQSHLQAPTRIFQYLEDGLKDDRPYLAGDTFTNADIMMHVPLKIATWNRQVRTADFPKVAAYYERIASRPAYLRVAAKALTGGQPARSSSIVLGGIGAEGPLPL